MDSYAHTQSEHLVGSRTAAASIHPVVGRHQALPLSLAQHQLWVSGKLNRTAAPHVTAGLRLRGKLDRGALRAALDRISARHEVLRTTFHSVEGEPVQVAGPPDRSFALVEQAVRGDSAVEQITRQEALDPFDLSSGPLIRGRLLRVSKQEHVLLITQHQIISDSWSIGVLIRELTALYSAFAFGQGDPLPSLQLQYADYASWQRQQVTAEMVKDHLEFWTHTLSGASELLQLPTDRPRSTAQSYKCDRFQLRLPVELMKELREVARQHGVTLFVMLLSGWAVLLGRWSGQEEVVIGTQLANRRRPETEALIGLFENTAALRIRLQGDRTVEELLRQAKITMAEACAHQEVPFEQVVEALKPFRGCSSVFQVLMELNETPAAITGRAEPELPGLQVSDVWIESSKPQLDLSLSLQDADEGLVGTLAYASGLFNRETIERMVGCWKVLLEGIVTDPQQSLSRLPMLTADEYDRVVRLFNATEAGYPQEKLIHELFEGQVRWNPDAVAVAYEGQSLTYADLNRRANQLARYLRDKGVGPDQLVALCVERSLEMVVGLLGILKAGGAYVPLDPAYPPERLAYMLKDAAPKALLIQARLRERLPDTAAEVIALDSDWKEIGENITGNLDLRAIGLRPHHLAYVIYTSGSTGEPKGVMVEHRNVTRLFAATEKWFGFNDRDVWTLFHSFAFDFSVWELWGALLYGGRVVVVPYLTARSPQEFYRLVCEEGVTVLNQTPSAFAQLIDAQAQSAEQRHSLRVVIFGGEALEFRTLRPWVERNGAERPQLVNMYGITETTVHVTYRLLSKEEIASERGSLVGKPIPDLRAYLLDRHRQPVPIGVVGEIYVSGAGVARGYLNRPELTAERFVADPFSADPQARLYKTGDLGRWRADGTIEYLGRNDRQVKIRGFRIELGEIEAQLARHAQVKEAVVIAREDVPGEKRLVGYVTVDLPQLKAQQQEDSNEAGAEIVGQWKSLYEETYSAGASGPSFVGWNSSYTGQPIPEKQMREWLENTLQRIRSLKPRRVLEIGCGVGLLLEQLASSCEVYRGTDFSGEAIERLRQWIAQRAELQHVQLEQCSALELQAQPGGYDTVILNSVVQYFPDIDYLHTVLERAVSWVSPGGRIFVGDARHLGLLRVFHSSVQLERAAADVSATTLKGRVARAMELEKELVIDPRFFDELREELPGIGGVQILLKRGQSDNELTRYRYDVVLEVGGPRVTVGHERVDWRPVKDSVAEICAQLEERHPRSFRICGVRNRRLCRDLAAARLIDKSEESCTAGMLRDCLGTLEVEGESPETFWKLGERQGYEVRVGWTLGCEEGSFDVEYMAPTSVAAGDAVRGIKGSRAKRAASMRGRRKQYTNDPLGRVLKQQLVPRLRNYLTEKLPPYMVPSALVVLESFPLTANGKLDRRALPAPELGAYASREYEALEGEVEEVLAGIWQELLQVERVGRLDNFFELGGHSLLIVQMMERLRRIGLSAEVRSVFESPTLAALAKTLGGETVEQVQVPPNLIPPESEAITSQMLPLVELDPEQIERIVEAVPGGAKNVKDIYPLAPLQEGMLFHHLLDQQGGDTYVLLLLFSLSSRERLEKFIGALEAVIDRHDILRTAVLWEHLPRPVQVVYRRALLPVEELVLDRNRDSLEQLKARMRPESQRLDLRRAPLMRLQVAEDAHGMQWYALLQIHHLIHDHASLDTMLAEVMAHVEGRARELPEAVSFRNHVAQILAHAQTQDAEAFFRAKLGEVEEPTAPFGLLNVHGDGSRIEEVRQPLEPSLARQVRAQARRLNVSAATLFHAAWALVVSGTSGRDDVVYGTVLLGQLQGTAAGQRMLGVFINTLPLRLRLQDVTVRELVQQTQRELAELLNHEQASLAAAQRCSGLTGSAPVFTSLLNYLHGAPTPEIAQAHVTSGIQPIAFHEWTNYPIAISVADRGEEFVVTAQTDRRIDPHRMTEYISTAMRSLVEALEQAPQTPALALSILPERERHQVIELFNATQAAYPQEKLIHELFEEQVERTPDAAAVVYEGQSLTYAELNGRANQLARHLRDKGVGPDQLVAICAERSLEMVVGLVGILKAGGAYVPLDPAHPSERLGYVLKDAAPRVLLIQQRLRERLPDMAAAVIALDKEWNEIAETSTGNLDSRATGLRSHHLAYVIYTSGSTGEPKGVMVEHRNVTRLFTATEQWFGFNERDVWTLFHSFAFDFSVWELWGALLYGARVVVVPYLTARSPQEFYRLVCEEGVTVLNQTPSAFAQLIDAQAQSSEKRHSLRVVIFGGEALEFRTLRPWVERNGAERPQLVNMYGITETTVHGTYRPLSAQEIESEGGSLVGKPIPDLRAYLLDRHRQPVPIGVVGEIYVSGAGVARGYLNRPELTAERFLRDPFSADPQARMYKTGDLGRWRADGAIEYLGRNDHQVKIRGFRIELGEIEAQLARHPQVKEAVVLAREDVPGEKRLVAYVIHKDPSRSEAAPSVEVLRAHLKSVLPEHMVPSAFVMLERFPLTSNGKLDRRALPAPELGAFVGRHYDEAPEGEVEETLAGIWQGLLRLERVGRHDNFFELGGHSLLAMQVLVCIQSSLYVEMPVSTLFRFPTVEQLSAQVALLRQARLLEKFAGGGDDIKGLLDRVASMPESEVQQLVRKLRLGARP